MKDKPTNVAASVMARLLNRTHQTGEDYQVILGSYCTERFLYRLGVSASRDRFVLKGATLLRLLSEQPYRATRDLDLLRRGEAPSTRSGRTSKTSALSRWSPTECPSKPAE